MASRRVMGCLYAIKARVSARQAKIQGRLEILTKAGMTSWCSGLVAYPPATSRSLFHTLRLLYSAVNSSNTCPSAAGCCKAVAI